MEYIVETIRLTKTYKQEHAVDNIQLQIPKGSIYGFLGPNGAGKTTTIRMLLGLIKPTYGEVMMFNKPFLKNRVELLGKVGSLVENPSYYGHLNAVENLEVYRTLLEVPKERVKEVLELVGLTYAMKKKVKQYSLGMKQRLGIAIALLGDPELLILDEPTNGLDPQGIQEIRSLINELVKKRGITILVSSHLLAEIDQMADYVGIISKGKLIFQDRIEVLRKRATGEVRLRVGQMEHARKVALAQGVPVRIDQEQLVIEEVDDTKMASLITSFIRNDIPVYRIQDHHKSLEDIFLDVVRKGGVRDVQEALNQ
ncbi:MULTISPECIES: ABC transporter ATP-binding protein [Pontibacillus]|uniref:ABC transporter ATP-binding protein n=1 Tax=Pontibacillus chungwhensis TaxID=265426 RepID=A0ABY8V259_9BACI|nr:MULTISPECIES: ABC transporter ATP-binding protein [Pontibacillus]MCD5322452.1 ABC transporter ATP-binding protein [Pontibacillus sp. HN14]WIF99738.1 ABC transporter ATP-binding protein [Pontibacillus chungwhensis]